MTMKALHRREHFSEAEVEAPLERCASLRTLKSALTPWICASAFPKIDSNFRTDALATGEEETS
ncbi:hypothetical protein [Rhizobium sp. L9]|uniref:hypothetical protein n=1 Tax=Rhizobium sp. L9 TaxID=1340738 RepID=UPI0015969145|nr:hypothetical protein [Rhizobium sp. L9]